MGKEGECSTQRLDNRHHNDFCIKMGSCLNNLNVSLCMWGGGRAGGEGVGQSHSFAVSTNNNLRRERIEPRSFCLPCSLTPYR